ncbi:hypothetical protein [Polaromonas aquatica]|uniref:hypothetical protein n=1 Tax=Polaromonas aquatica TaxID=332657 RepID=UPI003D65285D
MRDYWLTKDLLQAAGIGFLLLALIGTGLALWLPKKWWGKLLAVLAVGFVIAIPIYKAIQDNHQQQVAVDDYKERLAKAEALFEKRCKTAGEKIYKAVDNVEGVFLMKVRPDGINFSNQYAMDDPYGRDVGGKGYIGSFVRSTAGDSLNPRVAEGRRAGFSFVEVKDTADNRLYSYRGVIKAVDGRDPNFELEVSEVSNAKARYGVTYEDISTREDRESWIAGGILKVVDMKTDEVIGQRIGYIFDPALGDITGGRGPWEAAIACKGAERKYGHNAQFVLKTLAPSTAK